MADRQPEILMPLPTTVTVTEALVLRSY